MLTEEQKIWFVVFLIATFIFIRVASVKWIEPFLKKYNKPGWLSRATDMSTIKGNMGVIVFCFIAIAFVWAGPDFFKMINPDFHHPTRKIEWSRITLTLASVFFMMASLINIYRIKRK